MIRFGRFALAAALLWVEGRGAAVESKVRVQLHPKVEVSGRVVTLADVARLSAADPSLLERMKTLPLGAAPMTGTRLTLSQADLARRIRRQTNLSDRDIQWTGARVCLLQSLTQLVPVEAILRCAEARLNSSGQNGSPRFRLEDRYLPRDLRVPAGKLELKAQDPSVASSGSKARRRALWVEAWVDGRFVRAIPVECEVESWGSVHATPEPEAGKGPEPAPVVARGAQATLRIREGLLTLESSVEALEDGRLGEQIRVKRAGGSGWFYARVVGPGELEVRP